MINGTTGGTGKYSYRTASSGRETVMVAHMPDDNFDLRIVFSHMGEPSMPILKVDENVAKLLLRALSDMAEDLSWDIRRFDERFTDEEKKK